MQLDAAQAETSRPLECVLRHVLKKTVEVVPTGLTVHGSGTSPFNMNSWSRTSQ